jgi:ribosomal-protein-alanine N-acetyltransferase
MTATKNTIDVVDMKRRHLRQVLAIESHTYERHWSRTVFEDELAQVGAGGRHYIVARAQRKVVGYAGVWVVPGVGEREAHVTNIVVHPERRRQGVGARLMCELARRARREGAVAWTLEVRASAVPAQEMYRQFEFSPAGVRKGYYEHGEDAVVMWCHTLGERDYLERHASCDDGAQR